MAEVQEKPELVDVFWTTYASSRGILKVSGCTLREEGKFASRGASFWGVVGKDCFLTEEAAQLDAKKRIERITAGLKKRLGRLKALQKGPVKVVPG